jgi:hypothetical protein
MQQPTPKNLAWRFLPVIVAAAIVPCTCSRDVRLTGRQLRKPTVRTVAHYGQALTPQASPEQVAFVALSAIREDFTAADHAARESALDKLFDVCAANQLVRRNQMKLADEEFLYRVVSWWTPTVSHYIGSFPATWEEARRRFVRRERTVDEGSTPGCEVLLPVDDPSGDPRARVIVIVWLLQDGGYWRVSHLGFQTGKRSLDGAASPPTEKK